MDYSVLCDAVLVKLFQTGDEEAFQAIYRQYWHPLFAVARKKLYSQENAEELVQDLFVDLWERRQTIQIDDLKKYLFGAVKYKILNQIKAVLIRQKYENFKIASLSDYDCHTENLLAYDDLTKALELGIAHLPDKTRQIFRLNRMENHSVREISAQLCIPERTVEYHIMQSLRTLRLHLKEYVGAV